MTQVWLHVGRVQYPYNYPNAKMGDLEFQFGDGPPGQRTYSKDYVDLNQGLDEHEDCEIVVSLGNFRSAGLACCFMLYMHLVQDAKED